MSVISFLINRYYIKQPRLRSAITRLFYGTDDRNLDLFGSDFVVNSLRENGYVRGAKKMQFSSLLRDEVSVLLSLSTLLDAGDTFVDVGANIGLFSKTLARVNRISERPTVRFYAYEPHPDTFSRLQTNTERFGIVACNLAASDQRGDLMFVEGAVSHVFTVAERSSAYSLPNRRRLVSCVRLDEEAIDGDSIILKVDVENQELAVLRGAQKWFEAGRVKAVYLDGYADGADVEQFLKDFDFRFFNGRSLAAFRAGDFSLLAIRSDKCDTPCQS